MKRSFEISPKLRAHNRVIERFNSKIFCSAPFTHMQFTENNQITACCKSKTSLGDCSNDKTEDIYNSPIAKELRRFMLEGKKHPQCVSCWNVEKQHEGFPSGNRRDSNSQMYTDYGLAELEKNILPDGTLKNPIPGFVDLLWTNKCNFACLGCKPQFSTTINDVYKTEFATLQGFKLEDYYPDQQEWKSGNEEKIRFILENKEQIKVIHLQGGEPFLVDDVYDFLQSMIDVGLHKTCKLVAHTNGSIHKNRKGKDLIGDYLGHWGKNARILMSIDGIGQRGEYIRYGWKEKVWRKTFDKLVESDIDVATDSRANIFNLLTIPHFEDYIYNMCNKNKVDVNEPKLEVWQNETLNVALAKIHEPTRLKAIRAMKHVSYMPGWKNNSKKIIDWLENDYMPRPKDVKSFIDGVIALDKKRRINFHDTFPELHDWWESAELLARSIDYKEDENWKDLEKVAVIVR